MTKNKVQRTENKYIVPYLFDMFTSYLLTYTVNIRLVIFNN